MHPYFTPTTYPNSMPVYLVVIMSCHALYTAWGHCACQLRACVRASVFFCVCLSLCLCVFFCVFVFVPLLQYMRVCFCVNVNICVECILIYASCHICVHSPFIYVIRASHTERDVNMKRQLVEDLKTRLKFLQEMEKSYRGQVEELERKVHMTQSL